MTERILDDLVEAARLHQMSNAEVRAQKDAIGSLIPVESPIT